MRTKQVGMFPSELVDSGLRRGRFSGSHNCLANAILPRSVTFREQFRVLNCFLHSFVLLHEVCLTSIHTVPFVNKGNHTVIGTLII